MAQKHISKDGRGRITSKITKPKDWAYRTPSEGRAKHVHSPRAKKIKMQHSLWHDVHLMKMMLSTRAGTKHCEWDISSESPARKLTAQDVLDLYHTLDMRLISGIEVKWNDEHRILIFPDLSDILTGARADLIEPALTKDEIEIAKRHVSTVAKPVLINLKSVQKKLKKKSQSKELCGPKIK